MMYNTQITIDKLRKENRIFFRNAKFHGDRKYDVVTKNGNNFLDVTVSFPNIHIVSYLIDEDYKLSKA